MVIEMPVQGEPPVSCCALFIFLLEVNSFEGLRATNFPVHAFQVWDS